MTEQFEARVESFDGLGELLSMELLVARDDLLPFPLPGNKVRKLAAELAVVDRNAVLLSNGSVDSNHCRTLAFMGAQQQQAVHLVLHAGDSFSRYGPSVAMLDALGATYDVVQPVDMRRALDDAEERITRESGAVRRIAGGCHTPLGAIAYRDVGRSTIQAWRPDVIVVASGTGATHGGLAAAAAEFPGTRVIGVSVARGHARGIGAVEEASSWAGSVRTEIEFVDSYLDGGYGRYSESTATAVRLAWRHGLPLDFTYTGKAFAALIDPDFLAKNLRGKRVLFWHTGGLMNYLSESRS